MDSCSGEENTIIICIFRYIYTSSAHLTIRRPFRERTFAHHSVKLHASFYIKYYHYLTRSNNFHIFFENNSESNFQCVVQSVVGIASFRHFRLPAPTSVVNFVWHLSSKKTGEVF